MKVVLVLAAVLLPCVVSAGLVGGRTPVKLDLFDNKVGYASKAINDYFKSQNSEPHQVAEVISATRQVVSGILYRLKLKMTRGNDVQICDIQVIYQPWLTESVHHNNLHCEPESQPLLGAAGPQRQLTNCGLSSNGLRLPGGVWPYKANLKNESVIFATSAINGYFKSQDINAAPRTAVKLLCSTSQVVSGVLYRYKIELENGNDSDICDVQVLSRPWDTPIYTADNILCEKKKESTETEPLLVADHHVDVSKQQAQLLGGWVDADFNDNMVEAALVRVVDKFNEMSNSTYRAIPDGGRVTKQVVRGIIFRFKEVPMVETFCRNSPESVGKFSAESCTINDNSKTNFGKVFAEVYWDLEKFIIRKFDILKI